MLFSAKRTFNVSEGCVVEEHVSKHLNEVLYSYYVNGHFCFGVLTPFNEEDLFNLFSMGYFDDFIEG